MPALSKQDMSVSETELAIRAVGGDQTAIKALKLLREQNASKPAGGSFTAILDPYGNIRSFFNPKTGQIVAPPEEGGRKTPLSELALRERATLGELITQVDLLEELAIGNRGSIGPVDSMAGWLASKTVGNIPAVAEMRRLAGNLADMLLRARSGAQINEQEYARLVSLVPQTSDPETNFFAKLRSFRDELKRVQASRIGQSGGQNELQGGVPSGATHIAPGSDGKNHYTNAQGQDLGVAP